MCRPAHLRKANDAAHVSRSAASRAKALTSDSQAPRQILPPTPRHLCRRRLGCGRLTKELIPMNRTALAAAALVAVVGVSSTACSGGGGQSVATTVAAPTTVVIPTSTAPTTTAPVSTTV